MDTVPYAEIPYVNKKVSRIFFGTASSVFTSGGDADALLSGMLDLGINAIDTARNYGQSEAVIGRWLHRSGRRDEVVILSKCAHPTPLHRRRVNEKAIREDLETSLRMLGTDYIDIYLLHRDDTSIEPSVAVEIMNALHAEGKIGAFGGSNWSRARIEAANEYAKANHLIPFTVSSPNFSLAHQVKDPWGAGCQTLSGPEHAADRTWYREQGIPVVAYSPLGRGFFSGRFSGNETDKAKQMLDSPARKGYAYPENFERLRRCEKLAAEKNCTVAQLALAWLLSQEPEVFPVVSASGTARMRENIAAFQIGLTPEECAWLNLERETL